MTKTATTSAVLRLPVAFTYPQWKANRAVGAGRIIMLAWGRGIGKSHWIRQQWWMAVAKWDGKLRENARKPLRGVRITVVMATLTQFADVHWDAIEQDLGPGGEWAFLRGKLDRTRKQVRFPGGSWLKPFPATVANSKRARGVRTDIISVDEADDIDAEVFDAVSMPWISEPWSLKTILIAGTPTRGRHGLWYRTLKQGRLGKRLRKGEPVESVLTAEEVERYSGLAGDGNLDKIVEAIRNTYAFHATYKDSPETVSERAIALAIATTPAATFKREWCADPDAGEGLVYVFEEDHHVREPPPINTFREFICGMDFGWTDPGVILLIGIQGHGNDATAWVLDEWYESEVVNGVWDERAKAWSFAKFWPDTSRPERIADLRSFGIEVGEAPKNKLGGIARVANLLHKRPHDMGDDGVVYYSRLYVAPKCKHTIAEFGLYRRKKNPDGTFSEEPEDKNDHAMDALAYALVGRFGRAPNYKTITSGR